MRLNAKAAKESDDGHEIVVLSDTVRQRRARTPSSTSQNNDQTSVMPDLLPKTFHLAESSSLFSSISDKRFDAEILTMESEQAAAAATRPAPSYEISMVEIREGNLQVIQNVNIKHDESVHTIQLESVKNFEPEHVEMVVIHDASEDTSDTDTCPTPSQSNCTSLEELKEVDGIDYGDDDEVLMRDLDENVIKIEKQRISFDNKHKNYEKEHDLLRDSEAAPGASGHVSAEKKKPIKIRPSLREILMSEERDSFYDSDKENYDDPIIFSEDEDIPRFSLELPADSDSDTVFFVFFFGGIRIFFVLIF